MTNKSGPSRNETDEPGGFSQVTPDTAEDRGSEEGLRLYLDLVARAPIGLMVLHLENMEDAGSFRILAANSAVVPVSGMPDLAVNSLIGRSFAEVSPAISATELPELFAAVIRSGSPRHLGEIRYGDERLPEGVYSIRAFPLPNRCVGIVFDDITERKRAEEALQRTAEELARSNAELEQFAYIASHDLHEPLRTVAGFTQLLARDYKDKLGAEAGEYLDRIVEGAKRMQVLINALLGYARVGNKRNPIERVDCRNIYQAAVANLKAAIEESGAVLTCGSLPTVMGDNAQLVQLFQNLLANAIKFRGQNHSQIHVSATPKGREWQFAVRDNGIGIDPNDFSRVFVIFQRIHSRDEYSGAGIGLAICKKIVEQHGGRMWVESEPGKGSTFYFTIPTAT